MLKQTIEELESSKCTGCGSCYQICPQKCITMVDDTEGFVIPKIDNASCVRCGLCTSSCPIINPLSGDDSGNTYAMRHCDEAILKESSSGGAFSFLAEEILNRKGIVYGCSSEFELSGKIIVHQIRVDNSRELEKLRGSKYVFSSTENTYVEALNDLKNGKWVLYTGTPCQIAGLKKYAKKEYEQLITCEILCHGTPNQKLLKKYIEYLQCKENGKIISYKFRSKDKGWGLFYEYLYKENETGKIKKVIGIADEDPYYLAFVKGKVYREACYNCVFANNKRIADITIGDYWGIELQHYDFASTKGVSAIMINNEKGTAFFESIAQKCFLKQVKREEVSVGNHNLYEPTKRPSSRDLAYEYIDSVPKDLFKNKPYSLNLKQKLVARIKKNITIEQKWKIKRIVQIIKKSN